jgi:SAM-dependent methyltransferase
MQNNTWSSFWKKPNDAFNRVMKVATNFFYRELMKRFPLKRGDVVLDYGCGPGFLINNFVDAGIDVTGADINEYFLQQNSEKFPGIEFVLLSDKTRISFTKRFDYIILLSIVQYFPSLENLDVIMQNLKEHLKPGGKIIIADVLDEHTSSARDATGILIECVRRGRAFAFARFILYLLLSDYRQTSKNNKLLLVSSDVVKGMAGKNGLSFETATGMTPHPTRMNYVLTRKE